MSFTLQIVGAPPGPGACYPSPYSALVADLSSRFQVIGLEALSTFSFGPSTPSVDMQNSPWFKTDAQNNPIGWYSFSGTWKPIPPPLIPGHMAPFWGLSSSVIAPWYLCLRGDTKVMMADGAERTIKDLVDSKCEDEVMSYDFENKRMTSAKIYDWHEGGSKKEDYRWIQSKKWDNKERTIYATKNHPFWTDRGWIEAGQMTNEDVAYKARPQLTAWGRQAILGMYLGDACIRSEDLICQVNHGIPQEEYVNFTCDKFHVKPHRYEPKGTNDLIEPHPWLNYKIGLNILWPEIKSLLKPEKISFELLNQIGLVGLAHWFMDDGSLEKDRRYPEYAKATFHTQGFSKESRDIIAQWFRESYGFDCSEYGCMATKGKKISLSQDGSRIFFALIAPYTHPSLRYKLPPKYADIPFVLPEMDFVHLSLSPNKCSYKEISELDPSKKNNTKFYKRYDIGVEETHCFFANGFLVHNCTGQVINGPINGSLTTPNMQGLTVIGTGTNPATGTNFTNQTQVGEEKHVLTVAELASHTHPTPNGTPFVTDESGVGVYGGGGFGNTQSATGSTGGGQGHNTIQPSMAAYWSIFWP